jgi:hypothetical protein
VAALVVPVTVVEPPVVLAPAVVVVFTAPPVVDDPPVVLAAAMPMPMPPVVPVVPGLVVAALVVPEPVTGPAVRVPPSAPVAVPALSLLQAPKTIGAKANISRFIRISVIPYRGQFPGVGRRDLASRLAPPNPCRPSAEDRGEARQLQHRDQGGAQPRHPKRRKDPPLCLGSDLARLVYCNSAGTGMVGLGAAA